MYSLLYKKTNYFYNKKIFFQFFLFLSILFFFSCNKNGFQEVEKGLKIKYIGRNESSESLKSGETAVLKFKYFNNNDSLIFDSESISPEIKIKISDTSLFSKAVLMLKKNEKAEFLINASDFYKNTQKKTLPEFLKDDELLRFEIELTDIKTNEDIEKEKIEAVHLKMEEEQILLNDYTEINEINQKPQKSGIIIINDKKGKGRFFAVFRLFC